MDGGIMGPYGPGGYEIAVSFTTPLRTFVLVFAPLSWGLGFSHIASPETAMLQIGPIKFQVQKAMWVGDAT